MTKENMFHNQYIVYNPLKYSKQVLVEESASSTESIVTSETFREYFTSAGTHGEISKFVFSDKGNLGEAGTGSYNYSTSIEYLRNIPSMTLFTLPVSVKVTDSDSKVYRHTLATWHVDFAGLLKDAKHVIAPGDTAVTSFGYDQWGNLSQKQLPGNSVDDTMWYKYEYDNHYHLFPTKISDRFGYSSTMSDYNYKFGVPLKTTDINGHEMISTVDNLGRITSIKGPNEIANGKPYTIKFEYFPQNMTKNSNGTINQPAYAVTKHYDPQFENDNIETVTLVDGFGRPIQVKKDAYIDGDQKMIVSGKVKYDAFGRPVETYYPTVCTLAHKLSYLPTPDNQPPTRTWYDALDRVTKTMLPDSATTEMTYGIANGYLKTTVKDALQNIQETYSTGSGLTVKTTQYASATEPINTHFLYDPINQLIEVTDAMGKKTISEYDNAGRRVSVTHPASGKTTFEYDLSGNLIAKQTENLRKEGAHKKIRYTYTFNRLDSIIYPNHPENNVRYQYGAPGAAFNRVGRLLAIEDGSGRQEFKYGLQGELTELSRTLVIPNQGVANYVTQWQYDSWNRLTSMVYPDGETVSYSYNQGGLLNRVTGSKNSVNTFYVDDIRYDKFEQRTLLKYGNGTQTDYSYNPLNRLMNTLKVQKGSTVLMNNAYSYDAVQNITGIVSSDITQGAIGGSMSHQFWYDNLNRLDSARGSFVGPNSKKADYTLGLSYDNLHNITRKTQDIVQQNLKFDGILSTGYNLSYAYADNSQQIANIADASYRADRSGGTYSTGRQQTDVLNEKAQSFTYDANGNMTYVATGKKLNDSTLQATSSRQLLWDEENRLLAISDNGYVSNYWYDAAGERTVKQSGGSEGVFVNGVFSGGSTKSGKFTAYISPYMVVSNGGNYSKHIYMGSQRIISKLSNSGIFEASPVTSTQQQAKYTLQTSKIKERFDSLGVVYTGTPQTGGLVSSNPALAASSYFYHPDHLGSSSLITDGTGALTQHIQYVPFGEVFVEERTNSWSTPYKFNGKELDEETGLYYFHARYYDPRLSVWMSVDPLAEKYFWTSSYVYCLNNPVKYTDPTGMEVEADAKSQINIINSLTEEEAKFVKFDKNGKLDKKKLNKSKSTSENMTALKTLANETTIYYFSVVDKFIDGDGKEWIFQNDPSLGTVGLTSVPNGIEAPSPDNKVHILVSNKTSDEKQASTTAHEAYGHAYLYVLSKTNNSINPWHEYDKIMTKTWLAEFNTYEYTATFKEKDTPQKIRIQIVENQAIFNFNNRKENKKK